MFLGEAVMVAVYLLNHSPTKSLNGKTPFKAWFGRKPGVRHLRMFGCVAYAKRNGPGVTKLDDRSTSGVFLGYELGTKGYMVYDAMNDRLLVTRDVVFNEKKAWNWEGSDNRQSNGAAIPDIFTVQYSDIVPGPTTGPKTHSEGFAGSEPTDGEPLSLAASIPSVGGVHLAHRRTLQVLVLKVPARVHLFIHLHTYSEPRCLLMPLKTLTVHRCVTGASQICLTPLMKCSTSSIVVYALL
jgi:hypothetical protein